MAGERPTYEDRIIRDPAIMVGKPVVRGTCIPVAVVLGFMAENPDLDELFAAYPRLTLEDVKARLAYARRSNAPADRCRRRCGALGRRYGVPDR